MRYIRNFGWVSLAVLLFLSLGCKPKINVISIGDSWAEGWCDAMEKVILSHGRAVEVWNKGLAGTTADLWAQPGALLDVKATLIGNREITWAVVSMGGNDLLDGYLLYGYGDEVFPLIEADIRTVIDELLAVAPYLKISLNGYDFPNFVYCAECILEGQMYLGGDTYFQNTLFAGLTDIAQRIADDYDQVYATSLLGTLQQAAGWPNPPNYNLPSPAKFYPDADCIHPSNGGYEKIMAVIYDNFFDVLSDI